MIHDYSLLFVDNVTLISLIGALAIFTFLAVQSKNIKTFQFQISAFIIILIVGEIIGLLENLELVSSSGIENTGMMVHLIAMIYLPVVLFSRFYYFRTKGMTLTESIDDFNIL